MNTQDRKGMEKMDRPEHDQSGVRRQTTEDIRKSQEDLKPHTGMRPDRFPKSSMTKDQRADAKRVHQQEDNDEPSIGELTGDSAGTVGSRTTGSSPEDTAGVADLDRGMRRARRRKA